MDIDDEVKNLIFRRYREASHFIHSSEWLHLVLCHEVQVEKADIEWECLCYSEYTREDQMTMVALINCPHGVEDKFAWGRHGDIPKILKELWQKAWLEETPVCVYEEDD